MESWFSFLLHQNTVFFSRKRKIHPKPGKYFLWNRKFPHNMKHIGHEGRKAWSSTDIYDSQQTCWPGLCMHWSEKKGEKKSFPSSQGYKVFTNFALVKFTWHVLLFYAALLKNICKMLCTDTQVIFHSHVVPGNNSPRHLVPMEWVLLLWLGELTSTTKYLEVLSAAVKSLAN